jgi:hypothetical protein
VTCRAGFAAVPSDEPRAATCEDPPHYNVSCQFCAFGAPELECRAKECLWGDDQDPNARNETPRALVGGSVVATCNPGFRAAVGDSSALSDPASYVTTCVSSSCGLNASLACAPVRCPAPDVNAAPVNASAASLNLFAHGDALAYRCNESQAVSVAPGGGLACVDTAWALCDAGALRWGLSANASTAGQRLPGGAPLCVPKACPALDPAAHPNATFPAGAGPRGAVLYPAGAAGVNTTVTCAAGFRTGPSPSLPASPKQYVAQCQSCAWAPLGGGGSWPRCAPATCVAFDAENPPASVEAVYVAAPGGKEKGGNESSDSDGALGLAYGESVEVRCAAGFRMRGDNARRQAMVRCTDEGYAPLYASGKPAANASAELEGVCVPLRCDVFPPRPIPNGTPINTSLELGAPAHFRCAEGFYAQGGECSTREGTVASCAADGSWPPRLGELCLPVPPAGECVHLDPYADPPRNATPFAALANVSCRAGFAVAGDDAAQYLVADEGLATEYQVTCADCRAEPSGRCVPVACPAADWGAEDPNVVGWRSELSDTGTVAAQGTSFLLSCRDGYRAGSETDGCTAEDDAAPSCPPDAPRALAVTCTLLNGTVAELSSRKADSPPPPLLVLSGHAASLTPY